MAGEIFVGSVSVSVVPDLRDFNRRLSAELVPAANRVGEAMGREISKGILGNLDMGDIVTKSMTKGLPAIRRAGTAAGLEFGARMRKGIDDALRGYSAKIKIDYDKKSLDRFRERVGKDMTIKVKIQVDRDSVTRVRAAVAYAARAGAADAFKGIIPGGGGGGGGIFSRLFGGGGGAGGGGAALAGGGGAAAGTALRGNQLAALGQLFAGAPLPVQVGVAGAGLAALPFLAQLLSGGLVSGLGTGLVGLGVAGAIQPGATSPQDVAKAQGALAVAREREYAAQLRLEHLRTSGKATAAQLASAEASLASATNSVATAQQKASDAMENVQSKGAVAVRQAFDDLKQHALASLSTIGRAFQPVLVHIAGTISGTITKLTPVFSKVMQGLAGPFQRFSDAIIKTFGSPSVQKAIEAVGISFGKILDAFTPDLPGIINSFAQAIERMAYAVAKNPKAFTDFLNFLFQIGIMLIDALAYMTDFAAYMEQHFVPFFMRIGHEIAVIWDGVRHEFMVIMDQWFSDSIGRVIRFTHMQEVAFNDLKHAIAVIFDNIKISSIQIWDLIWNNIIGRTIRGWHDVVNIFHQVYQGAVIWWTNTMNQSRAIWDTIWNNTVGRAIRGWHDLMGVFGSLKNSVVGFFSSAGSWLVNFGRDIINGLFSGIRSAMGGVGGFIKNTVVDPVVNSVKHFFGISSPSTVMIGIGKNITAGMISGIMHGAKNLGGMIKLIFGGWPQALGGLVTKGLVDIAKLPRKALDALGSVAGKIGGFASGLWHKVFGGGSGVQQWAGTVLQALSLLHLPMGLMGQVLYQMQTESGGNPNAINLWDINAKHGDPSRGLMQVIGGTFSAFHVPGTSGNIYDPLANIAAAINYALHRYGPSLMSGGMGMGSGHGYARGTDGAAAGWAWVGERGPELVRFRGGETVLDTVTSMMTSIRAGGYAGGTGYVTQTQLDVANAIDAQIAAANASREAAKHSAAAARHAHAAVVAAHRHQRALAAHERALAAHERALARHAAALQRAAERHAAAIARAHARLMQQLANHGASIAASFAKVTPATTTTQLLNDQTNFLKQIRFYFTPQQAAIRSRLVIRQVSELTQIKTQLATVSKNLTDAQNFQKQVQGSLAGYGGITAISLNQGTGAAGGRTILQGFQQQVATMNLFGKSIQGLVKAGADQATLQKVALMAPMEGTAYAQGLTKALRKLHYMHAPQSIINSLMAAGPETANAYADAMAAAGPSVEKQIWAAAGRLDTARQAVSRGITSAIYEKGAYITGANFLNGLKSQQAGLEKLFAHLGRTLAQEAIRWFRVPAKQRPYGYQFGGVLNEPVSGVGLYSGNLYTFAERGREYVVPEGGMHGVGSGPTYIAHFDSLTGAAIESHVRTAYHAMAITQGNLSRQGRRTLCL